MTYSGKHSPPADGRPITLKRFLWFLNFLWFFSIFKFFYLWCPGGAWAIFWAVVCKNDFPKKIKFSHWLRRARKKNSPKTHRAWRDRGSADVCMNSNFCLCELDNQYHHQYPKHIDLILKNSQRNIFQRQTYLRY